MKFLNIKKLFLALLVISSLLILSCERIFIKPDDVGSEPVRNFELFWNDIDKTYPFFVDDNVDWQAIYNEYRPKVKSNTSTTELFDIFVSMMSPLMDGHRRLSYKSGSTDLFWTQAPKYKLGDRYNIKTLEQKYLNNIITLTQPNEDDPSETDTVLITATIDNGNYAYIGVKSYFTELSLKAKVIEFLEKLPNAKGYIIDIRNNGGGYLYQMMELMSLFTAITTPYATYHPKVGPLQTSLMPLKGLRGGDFFIEPQGQFSAKPMAVITNRICYSAAEHTALAANEMGIPTVGDTTGGALSLVVEKTLPNGIQFVLVNSRTLDMRNKLWERIGVPPTVYVKATKNDFNNKDPYLDKAIEMINGKIGLF